jgi:O-antigen/teichoic acid export membrane protein
LSVKRNTAYNVMGLVLPIGLSLLTVPAYLKLVGNERYGVLAIAWLLLGYFGLFDLGLGRSTSYRVASLKAESPQARADTFWAALAVNVIMGGLGGLLLFAGASLFFGQIFKIDPSLRGEALYSVPLLACAVPIATLTGTLTGAMQGREKFLETNIVSLLSTALFQLLPLAVAFWVGPSLPLLLGAAILARFTAIGVLAWRCWQEFCRSTVRRFVKSEIGVLLRYGIWVNLTSLLAPLLFMIDRFAIGAVLGAAAVTIYTVPFQLAQRVQILPGALAHALFPHLSSVSPEEQRGIADMAQRTLCAIMSLPVLGAIFIIEPFLRVWVGDRIGPESGEIGRIVLVGFFINALAQLSFIRLQASGRPKLVTLATIAEIPIYNLALFIALKQYGFLGCSLLFVCRCTVDYAILTWLAERRIPGLTTLSTTMGLLVLGVLAAGAWTMGDWRWWASAVALGTAILGVGWLGLPDEMRQRALTSRLGRLVTGFLPS